MHQAPSQEQENVLQRVLQLPVVSGTCECVQKTYSSTKDAHPLVASVCNAYERGVQGAGSLAAWGMEPVVRRLSTQCECHPWHARPHPSPDFGRPGRELGTHFHTSCPIPWHSGVLALRTMALIGLRDFQYDLLAEELHRSGSGGSHQHISSPSLAVTAANDLACRGLDHLEEKIPALQYPPEKVGSSPGIFQFASRETGGMGLHIGLPKQRSVDIESEHRIPGQAASGAVLEGVPCSLMVGTGPATGSGGLGPAFQAWLLPRA